jgi:hypothetical protein
MYALKKITITPNGRHVEECFILGNMYRLEFHPDDPLLAATIEYSDGVSMPSLPIYRSDEAYITTLTGETVRRVCRGNQKEREKLVVERQPAA